MCCATVGLRGSRDGYRFWLEHIDRNDPKNAETVEQAEFVIAHLKPIDRAIAFQINPQRVSRDPLAEYYLCDNYDAETQRCRDYEHRPALCRDFPMYGETLEERVAKGGLASFPQCSYWNLVPREQWPAHVSEATVTPLPQNCC